MISFLLHCRIPAVLLGAQTNKTKHQQGWPNTETAMMAHDRVDNDPVQAEHRSRTGSFAILWPTDTHKYTCVCRSPPVPLPPPHVSLLPLLYWLTPSLFVVKPSTTKENKIGYIFLPPDIAADALFFFSFSVFCLTAHSILWVASSPFSLPEASIRRHVCIQILIWTHNMQIVIESILLGRERERGGGGGTYAC